MPETSLPTTPNSKLPANNLLRALAVVTILLLALAGYLGWQVSSLNSDNAALKDQVRRLTPTASSSAKTTTPATSSATPAAPAATPATSAISSTLKANIADAISSGNTAGLESAMATSVNVVVAASGKTGSESPAKAVADLDFLTAGTDPWNFNLTNATLTSYKAGPYGQYFGTGTYVGQSANNYVVSFGVSPVGKITTIFMAQNADLLR